ncbi:DUF1365 domain-containing protein [Hyphobacterium sp.]|uniref:DUF1365 domain-containing protein n=1 Tax=Hyphobacterium sp. TaxID=2004662 RepID=UPI003B51F758
MNQPLVIWRGATRHQRSKPFRHGFRYPVAMIEIDLDRLEAAQSVSRWFRVNRAGLFSFHERDFGARDGHSLKHWSAARFAEAGIAGVKRTSLLCQPRILGYQFNPIALHYGYDADDQLIGLIYEVHNTFGDTHAYVAPLQGMGVLRHVAHKTLHVSPFFDVSGQYAFTLAPPDETLALSIRKSGKEGEDFRASMALKRQAATGSAFLRWFAGFPLSTLFTIAAIHFEALKLVIKGARYHKRPEPPARPATRVLESRPQSR